MTEIERINVYTMGIGDLTPVQFDKMIIENEITALVDVRSKPRG